VRGREHPRQLGGARGSSRIWIRGEAGRRRGTAEDRSCLLVLVEQSEDGGRQTGVVPF
jgi:hypothetical protein